MSLTTALAGAVECFDFIFVPYRRCNKPKPLTYFVQPVYLSNADGGHYCSEEQRISIHVVLMLLTISVCVPIASETVAALTVK